MFNTYIYVYTCIYMHIPTYTDIYMQYEHICIYVHIHTYVQIRAYTISTCKY